MRLPLSCFAVLLLALQYPLWVGHGGLLRVHQLEGEVAAQRTRNAEQKQRNLALEAEVRDLAGGSVAIEERARTDLGLVREGETWFRYSEAGNPAPAAPSHSR